MFVCLANKSGLVGVAHNHHSSSYLTIKFLSNSFVCEGSLLSLCVWEGRKGFMVMCSESD